MSYLKSFGIAVLGGLVVLAGFSLAPASVKKLGGGIGYDAIYQVGDIYQGLSQVLAFRDGVMTANVSSSQVQIGGGTAITSFSCNTASWNPLSIGTSSVNIAATSTDIALTGAVVGDTCSGSLTSATSSAARIQCTITGNATATLGLLNTGTAALDLATGTAKVCYSH